LLKGHQRESDGKNMVKIKIITAMTDGHKFGDILEVENNYAHSLIDRGLAILYFPSINDYEDKMLPGKHKKGTIKVK
jgi:hypothetical protein